MALRVRLGGTPRQRSRVRHILALAAIRHAVLAQLKRKGTVTIPPEVRNELDLHAGDELVMEVVDGVLVLIPPGKIPERDQTWYWDKSWQEGEAEADDDLEAGRVKSYDSAHDFLASLDDD